MSATGNIQSILDEVLSVSRRTLVGSFTGQVVDTYELFLNPAGEPVIVRHDELKRLRDGEKPRIIGANLETQRLCRVSLITLNTFTDARTLDDPSLVEHAVGLVRTCLPSLRRAEPPFYGTLSEFAASRSKFSVTPYRHGKPVVVWEALREIEARSAILGVSHSSIGREKNRLADRLNDADIALINLWAADDRYGAAPDQQNLAPADREKLTAERLANGPSYVPNRYKRLVYARLAEKFVAEFYQKQLGRPAVDVSVLQLENSDRRWKTHDIETDIPIDVKNARTFFNSRRRQNYVDKFKSTGGREVAIAGVLSDIGEPRWESGVRQTLLGLMTERDAVLAVDAVNGLPDRAFDIAFHFDAHYIPAWAFELEAYAPDYELLYRWSTIFARKPETILALSIACGKHKESDVYPALSPSQRDLCDRFAEAVARSSYRKLTIALFSISEFSSTIARGGNGAATIRFIRRMISIENFTDWHRTMSLANPGETHGVFDKKRIKIGSEYEIDIDYPGSDSGGLYDPARSLWDLLNLLEQCGERIAQSGIAFRHFDAPDPFMLLGRTDSGKKLTIYTYCGGKTTGGFRCDNFPLSIVKHPNCDRCGRLICDECGFCSEQCSERSHDGTEF